MRQPIKFGKYQLLERIAVGGMAEVFVAKAFGVEGFERLLAIKKILPTMGEDGEFIAMFVDEARIAVQLAHANIVQVLELGKHDDNLYIAMEYISGRDLRQLQERLRRRNQHIPVALACLVVAEVCEALDYAHRKRDARGVPLGIVHRDVSPQNVIVSFEGEVKLIDFGIAKAGSRLQNTQAGILKGKFSYMSPEQVRGHAMDARSDVFACGILLWELLCGEKLFTGDSDFAILEKVRQAAVPLPRKLNPQIPEALERVVMKALHGDVAQRYQSASELHDDLMRFTIVGEVMNGSRQLSTFLREEFRAEYEKEQARLRAWMQVVDPSEETTPVDPARKQQVDAFVAGRGATGDFAITPQDPFPAGLAQAILEAQNVPTQRMPVVSDGPASFPPAALKTAALQSAAEDAPTVKVDGNELAVAESRFIAHKNGPAHAAPPPPPPEDIPASLPGMRPITGPTRVAPPPAVPPGVPRSPASLRSSTKELEELELRHKRAQRRVLVWVSAPILLLAAGALAYLYLSNDEARPGKLVVTSTPSGAELFIDGKSAGPLPKVRAVTSGQHKLEVRADGYKPFRTTVTVTQSKPVEVDARLETDTPLQVEGVVLTQPKIAEPSLKPPDAPAEKRVRKSGLTP